MGVWGYNPIQAYYSLFKGAFGSVKDFAYSLTFATPLMLVAITFALGMKSGLFNIGGEGQLYMGAVGAVIVGGMIALPAGFHLFAATLVGMLFGALWALPVAILKIWRGAHEVVSTIMLNWVAFSLVAFLVIGPLIHPQMAHRTVEVMGTARYPFLWETADLTAVIFVALAFCIVIYVLLWRTRIGYELRLVGDNPDAARYAGINIQRVLLLNFLIGGLAAGLAGAAYVLGKPPVWGLYEDMSGVFGLGFSAIGIALIGRNHPIGGIFAAIFYGGLLHGRTDMMKDAGVASEMVMAILGIIVIALAIPELLNIIMKKIEGKPK